LRLFIKKCLLFILVLLLLFPVCFYIWGEFIPQIFRNASNVRYIDESNDFMRLRIQEAKTISDIDILVLGSSHAYRGFDPRIFSSHGLEMFNFGSSAQSPLQTEVLLKRYYHSLNPKIVIFEVYPSMFTWDGVESSISLLSSDIIDWHVVKMTLEINNVMTYNSLLLSFLKNMLNKSSSSTNVTKNEIDTYIEGGYVERNQQYYYEPEFIRSSQWEFNESQWQAFERCLKIIESNGAQVFLVYAPVTKNLYTSKLNNDEFLKRLAQYGYLLHDFNAISNLDDSLHFYDSDHMNQKGVEIFNHSLISELNF